VFQPGFVAHVVRFADRVVSSVFWKG
jgi:hypothetical protein